MKKLDKQFTQQIQDWLNTEPSMRDITTGAMMLLQCSRNRALYNSIIMRPQKYAAKLEYELRKYLRMRLDNMAVADVVRLEAQVIPQVRETVSRQPVLSEDTEIPAGSSYRGRRPDHNDLPADIQALWDTNLNRYHSIVHLYNELKAMHDSQPCDRYELLKQLADLDSKYRDNLAAYDSWHPDEDGGSVAFGQPFSGAGEVEPYPEDAATGDESLTDDTQGAESDAAEMIKKVAAARKSISKYRKRLTELEATDPKRDDVLIKLQSAVDTVLAAGVGFTDTVAIDLQEAGIKL